MPYVICQAETAKKKKQTKNTTFEKYVMKDSPNQLSTEKSH